MHSARPECLFRHRSTPTFIPCSQNCSSRRPYWNHWPVFVRASFPYRKRYCTWTWRTIFYWSTTSNHTTEFAVSARTKLEMMCNIHQPFLVWCIRSYLCILSKREWLTVNSVSLQVFGSMEHNYRKPKHNPNFLIYFKHLLVHWWGKIYPYLSLILVTYQFDCFIGRTTGNSIQNILNYVSRNIVPDITCPLSTSTHFLL